MRAAASEAKTINIEVVLYFGPTSASDHGIGPHFLCLLPLRDEFVAISSCMKCELDFFLIVRVVFTEMVIIHFSTVRVLPDWSIYRLVLNEECVTDSQGCSLLPLLWQSQVMVK